MSRKSKAECKQKNPEIKVLSYFLLAVLCPKPLLSNLNFEVNKTDYAWRSTVEIISWLVFIVYISFQVIVNGTEYQPSVASQNKKFAKAAAATAVLQEMGLVPRDS